MSFEWNVRVCPKRPALALGTAGQAWRGTGDAGSFSPGSVAALSCT